MTECLAIHRNVQCPEPATVVVKVAGDPYTEFTFCEPDADDFYDPEAGDTRYAIGQEAPTP